MMDAAAGTSTLDDPRQAVDEALSSVGARLAGRADLAVLFATSEYAEDIRSSAGRIREALGGCALIGGSTTGVISASGEHEGARKLGLLAIRGLRARASLAGDADEIEAQLRGAAHALALPDPRRLEASLLDALARSPAQIAGGGLSGSGQALFALADGASGEGGCALATLEGARVQIAVAQGAAPAGAFLRVTRARRNALLELDGMPAAQALAAHVQGAPGGAGQLANLLFVAVREPGDDGYTVRPIVDVEGPAGALRLPDEVHEGAEVAFAMRDTIAAMRNVHHALEQVRAQGPVAALLYFNWAGRGQSLYLDADADLLAIRRALPEVPLLGMTSSFELAPVGARNRMLMYSGVLVALRDA